MTTWCTPVLQLGLHRQGMQHPACSSAGFYRRQPGIVPSTVLDLNRNNTPGTWLIQEAQGPEALDCSSGFAAIFVVAALLGPADITRVLQMVTLPPFLLLSLHHSFPAFVFFSRPVQYFSPDFVHPPFTFPLSVITVIFSPPPNQI